MRDHHASVTHPPRIRRFKRISEPNKQRKVKTMIEVLLYLPEPMRLELAIHACACDLTVPQLLEFCAQSLVDNGRPKGWEKLTTEEEADALRIANLNLQAA